MPWNSRKDRLEERLLEDYFAVLNKWNEDRVPKSHKCFLLKGLSCVTCGVRATHVVVWRDSRTKDENASENICFIVRTEREDLLLTVDHIVPQSEGGSDAISNLQPMCHLCNNAKASTPDAIFKMFFDWCDDPEVARENAKQARKDARRHTGNAARIKRFIERGEKGKRNG